MADRDYIRNLSAPFNKELRGFMHSPMDFSNEEVSKSLDKALFSEIKEILTQSEQECFNNYSQTGHPIYIEQLLLSLYDSKSDSRDIAERKKTFYDILHRAYHHNSKNVKEELSLSYCDMVCRTICNSSVVNTSSAQQIRDRIPALLSSIRMMVTNETDLYKGLRRIKDNHIVTASDVQFTVPSTYQYHP